MACCYYTAGPLCLELISDPNYTQGSRKSSQLCIQPMRREALPPRRRLSMNEISLPHSTPADSFLYLPAPRQHSVRIFPESCLLSSLSYAEPTFTCLFLRRLKSSHPSIHPFIHSSIHSSLERKAPPSIINSYSLPSSFIRPSVRIHPSIRGTKQDLFPFFLFSKASEAEGQSNIQQKVHSFVHSFGI